MRLYKCLNKQIFQFKNFRILPIRHEDKFEIMNWRNDQIYHLRQSNLLTTEEQENYFNEVVDKLFEEEEPSQILFSFLENDICIGYGGLVHINWLDRNAEISFLMNTDLEEQCFDHHWITYLRLIQQVAFSELNFYKIYTFSFDLRPKLYIVLGESKFIEEARLKEHAKFKNQFVDVVIHSKFNESFKF